MKMKKGLEKIECRLKSLIDLSEVLSHKEEMLEGIMAFEVEEIKRALLELVEYLTNH